MHIEFAHYLKNLLEHFDGQGLFNLSVSNLHRVSGQNFSGLPEVTDCPSGIDGLICSNLAFLLASELSRSPKHCQVQDVSPRKLARQFVAASEFDVYFEVVAGGRGFLNAVPTPLFVASLFNRLVESDISVLFCTQNILIKSVSEDGLDTRLGESDFDWSTVLVNGIDHQDPCIKQFCRRLYAQDKVSADDRLMVFSLLADPELELGPYERGLFGRQNTPWYFRRFVQDWRTFESNCAHLGSAELSAEAVANICSTWCEYPGTKIPQIDSILRTIVTDILSFRSIYLSAVCRSRPEILLRHLLKLVRGFYSYYNLPQVRELTGLETGRTRNLSIVSKIIGRLVEKSLNLLEFPC